MNSFIGIRQDQVGGGTTPRSSAPSGGDSAVEYDEMDAVIHNDEEAAADFLERLGNLDQFVANASDPVTLALGDETALRNRPTVTSGFDGNGDFVVLDEATAPAGDRADEFVAEVDEPRSDSDEAQDFLDRLGDLDRFIATVPDDEVTEFHQRLSDLDRFVAGPDTAAPQASLCAACRKTVSPTDDSTVHAVHLLGAIEGRPIEGLPRQFHATCWIDGDGAYRRTR